ncbi:TetR/AcrR family transcriptional regulator [Limnohabitans sp. 63ED37-2]|uniref:TetR/AcrR family transcriptional regulator n=1 Tax=Limnohabitans sp. 63ED37-2 TaxID=1678128 RepID=UPI000706ACC2|nr:TetR/AcrR family transcriptional regulator [Limnohabitans sp. 63ED37-2]ALK88431.1 HTH-type transcriptional regulator BetI [Limnohabitans sp. 63ED37-2]
MKPNLHQVKRELTHERLLHSALTLVQEKGAGRLSIQAVAQAAGMTTGAVQHHFPSKAALMMQVLSLLIDSLESDTDFWPSPRWGLRRRSEHFVRQAWAQLYSQPRFASAWSAYLAAVDDVVMTAHIIEQRSLIQQRLRVQFLAAFPEIAIHRQAEAHMQFVLTTLRGLGLVRPFAPAAAIDSQLTLLSEFIQSIPTKPQETP